MPIFEFKCLQCGEVLEILIMNNDDQHELKCKKCNSEEMEKIINTTSYNMGIGSSSEGKSSGPSVETKTCGSGSCHTYNIPGYTR